MATAIGALLGLTVPVALATEIEGTQPFARGQPWVDMSVRREPNGRPLVSGRGVGKTSNIEALFDTGTATIVLSLNTAKAFGIKRAKKGNRDVTVDDFGVFGRAKLGVSEPLYVSLGTYGDARREIDYPMDGVNHHGRSDDIHLGRLDGDECRCLVGHGWFSW